MLGHARTGSLRGYPATSLERHNNTSCASLIGRAVNIASVSATVSLLLDLAAHDALLAVKYLAHIVFICHKSSFEVCFTFIYILICSMC